MPKSEIAEILGNFPNPLKPDMKFGSLQAFVLHYGRDFTYQPLPKRFQRGVIKQCFANSAAWLRKSFLKRWSPGLVYVEGYAMRPDIPLPTLHAWCIYEGSDRVIELTNQHFRHYYGIPFRTEYVMEQNGDFLGGVSLIDDWRNGFPLLQLDSLDGIVHV